ncbi:hydroxyethylthiazole kinase [Candidatus Poribacteria bacterium]|nr:hydroxyethylthiazole kinase [Candidatus Poribacteria bacterium]
MSEIYNILNKVRSEKPLVHHITNWVTIYDCANITRTFGALPVMAHAIEESADMVAIASALVLNIGTLTPELIKSMIKAGKAANEKNIPVVMDAVGAGATKLRTESANEILEYIKVDIIKGNSSEIGILAGADAEVKGVEAMGLEGDPVEITKNLAKSKNATVVITGKQDIVSDNNKTFLVNNGHAMMGSVVGTGCMSASVIGSFAAVEKDYALASTAALVCFGIAGELAANTESVYGPGTFKEAFYDSVYNLDQDKIDKMEKYKLIN